MQYLKDNPPILVALIGTAGVITVAFLNFLFNRWNSTHSKNYDKRAGIHDQNIQEAHDFLETYYTMIDGFEKHFRNIEEAIESKNGQKLKAEFIETLKFIGILRTRIDESYERIAGINMLKDKKLEKLLEE